MTTATPDVEKPEKPDFKIAGCFRVRVKDNAAKHALMSLVKFHGSHLRNMVLILRKQLYEAQEKDAAIKPLLAAFSSPSILRDTVYGRDGNVKASFEQFYTNIDRFKTSPSGYASLMGNSGAPRPPTAKRINQINKASLMVDGEKWAFKKLQVEKNGLTVTHHLLSVRIAAEGRISIPVNPTKFPVPPGHELRSLNINVSNDSVYLNFTYGKFAVAGVPKEAAEKASRQTKWAGIDVGLNNILSIFVADTETRSLLLCGKRYKHYNVRFNKHLSAINEDIASTVTQYKTIERDFKTKDGTEVKDTIKVPLTYSDAGHRLIQTRTHMRECRNRFFDAEFDKLSARVVNCFVQAGVTDVSLSRNLSFLKTKEEKSGNLRSSTRQQFYHLPFGRLLNHIARKCILQGISVHDIDEAYTSKVSCLSGNVNAIQQSRRQQRTGKLSATDCNGRRVQRGLFRDDGFGQSFHADINGAVNHIKVAEPSLDTTPFADHRWKLCNPDRLRSDQDFTRWLARNKSAEPANYHRAASARQGLRAQNETV